MKTVLLPVKEFNNAKQRLAPAMDAPGRAALARAMLTDVLAALKRSRTPDRIVVFTAAEEVKEMVEPFGFEILFERSVEGHSAAVNLLLDEFSGSSSSIFAIAGDLPKLTSSEIDFACSSSAIKASFSARKPIMAVTVALVPLISQMK